jgi:hypothetical protein
MTVLNTIQQLREWVERRDDGESSFALVVIGNKLDAPAVFAVRNASRMCDDVVVLYLAGDLPTEHRSLIGKAGAAAIYMPAMDGSMPPCAVSLLKEGVDVTSILQIILQIMPQAVAVPKNDPLMKHALDGLLNTFEGLFVLLEEDTPDYMLNGVQKRLRMCAEFSKNLYGGGEERTAYLLHAVEEEAVRQDLQVTCSFVDKKTLTESRAPSAEGLLLVMTSRVGDSIIRDVVHLA